MDSFRIWLEEFGGPEKLAFSVGVTSYSVRVWLERKGTPRIKNMQKIIKLSKGTLTMEDIVLSCQPPAERKPKPSKKAAH